MEFYVFANELYVVTLNARFCHRATVTTKDTVTLQVCNIGSTVDVTVEDFDRTLITQ